MKLSRPIHRLKQDARRLSREAQIPLHEALDRIARAEGFAAWSLLAARATAPLRPAGLLARLEPGELLLIGARPGHGKTLLGLGLAVEAMRSGRRSAFFTLEYTRGEVRDRLRAAGAGRDRFDGLFDLDASDGISDATIVERLAPAPRGTLAVIDYLQLLDRRRETPDLAQQVRTLRAFAREKGVILAFLSQIDRSYDPAARPCPDLDDVRLPNPLDLGLFDKACFLHQGRMRFRTCGPAGP